MTLLCFLFTMMVLRIEIYLKNLVPYEKYGDHKEQTNILKNTILFVLAGNVLELAVCNCFVRRNYTIIIKQFSIKKAKLM